MYRVILCLHRRGYQQCLLSATYVLKTIHLSDLQTVGFKKDSDILRDLENMTCI